MDKYPFIIAHRGASGRQPENTLPSFHYALVSGADIIETDLQLTSDGEVVAFHDQFVDRIFKNEKGKKISDFSLEELKNMDAGIWFGEQFKGATIPTLKEIIQIFNNKISFILEIKCKGSKEEKEKLIKEVSKIILENNFSLGKGYISVRDLESYQLTQHYLKDNYKIGLMQKATAPKTYIEMIKKFNISIAQIRWTKWTEGEWIQLSKTEAAVTAFYADNEEDYKKLIDRGIYGIFTNYPERLKGYIMTYKTDNK